MNYVIYCDGGALGNHTGTKSATAYGSFIIVPVDPVLQYRCEFGVGTNNEAEYAIVVSALLKLKEIVEGGGGKLSDQNVIIRTDSQLVIGQLDKGWKVNSYKLAEYVLQVGGLRSEFNSVKFEHFPGKEMKKILGH